MELRIDVDEAEEQASQDQSQRIREAQPARNERDDDGEDEEQDYLLDIDDGNERVRGRLLPLTKMCWCSVG